ncbi:MAG: phage holin family protein [Bacteroidota bacterium]
MSITLNLVIDWLILGASVASVAYLLPFVYVRNFGNALLVGILVSLFNAGILWGMSVLGVNLNVGYLTIANLILTTISVLLSDKIMKGFRIRNSWGALVFGLLVILINLGIHHLLGLTGLSF